MVLWAPPLSASDMGYAHVFALSCCSGFLQYALLQWFAAVSLVAVVCCGVACCGGLLGHVLVPLTKSLAARPHVDSVMVHDGTITDGDGAS